MANPVNKVMEDLNNVQPAPGEPIPDDVVAAANPFADNPMMAMIYKQMQQESAARRGALQSQMDIINKQAEQYGQKGMSDLDKASIFFQAAGALAAPTRSGALMESVGAAGSAVSGPLQKAAQADRDRQEKLMQLQMARAKLSAEMAGTGGVSPSNLLQLYKMQLEMQPKPSETERLLQTLSPEERQAAVRSKLGITPQLGETERLLQTLPEEERTAAIRKKLGVGETEGKPVPLTLSDGSTVTALFKDGKFYDPLTGKLFSEEQTISNRQQVAAADRKDQAIELGVPVEARDPFSNLPPKEREKARTARYNADTRLLQKQADEVPDAALRAEIGDYNRFVMLNNENQRTGPAWAKTGAWTATAQQMSEIEAKLKIAAGKDLKGAASDRDVAMFGQAVPSLSKDIKANANIARFGEMRARTELERRQFMRDYLAVNKNLDNADRLWQQYLNDNPFFKYPEGKFDPSKLKIDDLVRNDKRMSYQEYFRNKMGNRPTTVRRDASGALVAD